MRAHRSSALVVAAAVLGAALASCGGNRLTIGFEREPITLDPHLHNDNLTWAALCNFYDGLVEFDAELKLRGALAASWERVGERQVRFHLRPGVRFSNGEPLRAADVVASLARARDHPRSRVAHQLLGVVDARAEDEATVVIETDRFAPTLLNRLAFLFVVPEAEAGEEEIRRPNGTGSYRMVAEEPGRWLDADARECWRERPAIGRFRLVFFPTEDALFRAYRAGDVDVARTLPEAEVSRDDWRATSRIVAQPRIYVQMLAVNPGAAGERDERAALADVRVRRALLLATDRRRWLNELFSGAAAPASQYVHPAVFGFDPTLDVREYDRAEARSLLTQAGFPAGFATRLEYSEAQRAVALAVARDLGVVGVRVELREIGWTNLVARARDGSSPLVLFAWGCSTGDGSDFLNACVHTRARGYGGENYAGWSDARIDELIEEADREGDPVRRLALLQEAQRGVLDALPILPLTIRFGYLGTSDAIDVVGRHDQWMRVASFRVREGGGS